MVNDRIKDVRESLNLSQEAFGDKLHLKRNTISVIESGKRNVVDRVISDICREFNVNEQWLRTGKGEMFLPMGDDFESIISQYADDLSDNMKNMIKALLKLPKEKRAIFDELLEEIVRQNKQNN